MGKEARRNAAAFFRQHPVCIFCGGRAPATTKEHCPPRALFQNKEWPEGFVFPACERCNHGTNQYDVVAAFLARLDPFSNDGDRDGRLIGLFRNAHQQHPRLVKQMMDVSPVQARHSARKYGIPRPKGHTFADMGIVRVTDEMTEAVKTLARKLAKALFYVERKVVFPTSGAIQFTWFSNVDLFLPQGSPILNSFSGIETKKVPVVRNGQDLSPQFDCHVTVNEVDDLMLVKAIFGKAFGFVTIASATEGKLEAIYKQGKEAAGRKDDIFFFL